jgi:hypothetical protein
MTALTTLHLPASVETCHWGAFDATLPPVMTVASAQRFTVDTVSGSTGDVQRGLTALAQEGARMGARGGEVDTRPLDCSLRRLLGPRGLL